MTDRPADGSGRQVPIPVEAIVADLRSLRERGLVRLRHTELPALRAAAAMTIVVPAGESGPRAIEALVRAAVANLGGGQLGAAAARTFGLIPGTRDQPAQVRRQWAAREYGVSVERFRKHQERVVVEQVAEEILALGQPTVASTTAPVGSGATATGGTADRPELASQVRVEWREGDAAFPVIVHVEPIELVHDIDVLVAPANVYLEPPQAYKASVSAALRRAAARRSVDGTIIEDSLAAGLASWLAENGRPGLPVKAGTVAATSPGDLDRHGIRRVYHAAVTSPRPGTNDYDIEPASISQAVQAVFAVARAERDRFHPPLKSLGFPLLGAGRGGLSPATSFAWIWAAAERELRADPSWEIHFITRRRAAAAAVVAGLGARARRDGARGTAATAE